MRKMQQLIPTGRTTQMTSSFHGYNHTDVLYDGEMYDMQNMSGDSYPLLAPRAKRGITSLDVEGQASVPLTGIHGRDQLVFIRGTQVYYNLLPVAGITVSAEESMLPKKIVSFGAYVCIWPDKVFFNTANGNDYGSMERKWPASGSSITGANIALNMCRGDGTDYSTTEIATGNDPPENPANGQLWLDEGGSNDELKQWSSATGEWVEVATTYVKVTATGIGAGLKGYDVINITGMEAVSGSTGRIVQEIADLNGSRIIYFCGDDYIVIEGLINNSQEALKDQEVRADLTIPDLDYVCESNNRLWGCRYGLIDGQVVNEIKASKLGDFRNWNCYIGISTDSYTASVGTDGPFTGAITQRGYPVFFKEQCIHRVSGQTPATFSVQTTMARGVQRGSWRSLAIVSENIYYKSREAVMVYDGNMPTPVSEKLGDILYSDARAGVLNDKYYISMKDGNEHWHLFNYDTKYGTWYKEDGTQALGFGAADDDLYYIDEEKNTLVTVRGSVGTAEADFDWGAEFSLEGVHYTPEGSTDTPMRIRNSKYLSMFKIRMYLEPASIMRLWIKYDNDTKYEFMGEWQGKDIRSLNLPVVPKRCDHLRFKITGKGPAKIYDISRMMEVGGDG